MRSGAQQSHSYGPVGVSDTVAILATLLNFPVYGIRWIVSACVWIETRLKRWVCHVARKTVTHPEA